VTYSLEGSVFIAGAVVQWLRDGLGIIRTSAEVEQLAGSVSDSWRIRRENELVGHAEVSDDRERHPESKIGNYQKRG
jgi:hypothetical protein